MRTESPELPEAASPAVASVYLQAARSKGEKRWPDLPVAIKNGIGVKVGDIAYVGLGSGGTNLYALDLKNPNKGWEKKAAFIGPTTYSAAATAADGKIFVFSGNGKASPDATSPIIFDSVYAYDPSKDRWSRLDTRTPVGLSGAKALPLSDGCIAIVGGYNKDLFDRYLADLSALDRDESPVEFACLVNGYMGMSPEDYKWNDSVLSYDPKTNNWSSLGENPFPPTCDSAVVQTDRDTFLLLNGEIKPGLRTPSIKRVSFEGNAPRWHLMADLPTPDADDMQEGLAGAFAGCCGEKILVAGGVNFKGARANAAAGKWYAHQGLGKKWRDEIYSFDGTEWREVGKLPGGLGYGISLTVSEGLLFVGGEDSDGRARTEVFAVKLLGAGIVIEG